MSLNVEQIKHRVRLIQLLTAAEQAALTPISLDKLHAFAYLADILSPVWNLRPFQDRIGRTGQPPYYPDLQRQIDILVGMGMVEPSGLSYVLDEKKNARFSASYALRFESSHFSEIANALEQDDESRQEQTYLDALANALASLPDEEISQAASHDLIYERSSIDNADYIELNMVTEHSLSALAVASFDEAFPSSRLTPARRLYMYANYLGRRANG